MWLAGRSTLPIRDHQNTTLNRKTGNITFYSKPILLNGPKGEFFIADMHMDILNRVESDGSPFVTIDVTVTAKADYAWLWGIQTAVESIFISQAKDDIGAYLQSNIRTCQELVLAGKVPSQNGITTDDHLGLPGAAAPEEAETLHTLPNGGHAKALDGSVASGGAGKEALYSNDSVSVYYDASEKMRRPSSGAGQSNGALSPRTPGKTTSVLKGAKSPRSSSRKGTDMEPSARRAPSAVPTSAAPAISGSQTERRYDQRDKVRRMCQAWAEESVPVQSNSARARIGDNGRSAANYNALSPRSRERIRVTTPATSWEAAKPAAGDVPPAVRPAAPEAAKDAVDLKAPEETETTMDREGKYYIIMPSSQERFHTPANSIVPTNHHEAGVPAAVIEVPKTPAASRGLRRVPNQSPTPAQIAARRPPLTRKSASSLAHRRSELVGPNHNGPEHDMVNGDLLSPQKSISAPGTPRGTALGPDAHPRNQKWQDDSTSFKSEKRRPPQASTPGSSVRFQPGAAVGYGDARWPGHIVAVDHDDKSMSPRTAFPSAKRVTPVHMLESPFAGTPHAVAKAAPKTAQTTSSSPRQGLNDKPRVKPEMGPSVIGGAQGQTKAARTNGTSTAPAGRKMEKPNWFAKTFCGCSTPASE
ncbi:g9536 [Coccomyxa elongata]